MKPRITIEDIKAARSRLPGYVRITPINESTELSNLTGESINLKQEHQQITNSFKIRGASNAIAQLNDDQRASGVVCVSTGNHGRGIAYAAKQAEIKVKVFSTDQIPANKKAAIYNLGAQIDTSSPTQEQADQAAQDYADNTGAVFLSPFDHKDIICGQGTIGLEILDQYPAVENIIAPLSGGGLLSGIALAVKSLKPQCKIFGASMDSGPAMIKSIKARRIVSVNEQPTFADSLAGGLNHDNQYTFEMVKSLVDETVVISEAEIAAAIRHAYRYERQVIEGGAAVGLGAILANKINLAGPTVIVLSGGNINMNIHQAVLNGVNNLTEIRDY